MAKYRLVTEDALGDTNSDARALLNAAIAGGLNRKREALVDLFRAPATGVSIERVSANQHYLYQHLKSGKRIRYNLIRTVPPSGAIHDIRGVDLMHMVASPDTVHVVDQADAGVTLSGTWSTIASTGQAIGPNVRRSTVTGAYAEWTSPQPTKAVGFYTSRVTNLGVAEVSIDGDLTRANLLPTAQELVDAGRLPSTALTTNGGNILPTTRCHEGRGSPTSTGGIYVPLADGLNDAATHTVRITVTGQRHPSGTDVRVEVDAFTWTEEIDSLTEQVQLNLAPSSSVWTYALQVDLGGTTTFIGNGHGYDTQTGMTIELDGVDPALADAETAEGEEIVVTRTSTMKHPGSAGADIATALVEYRLRPDALVITSRVEFSTTTAGNNKFQVPMMALNSEAGAFAKGRTLAMGADAALTAHDGTLHGAGTVSDTVVMWQPSGRLAALVNIPDPDRTFGGDTMSVYIQDREGENIAKAYFQHDDVDIAPGSVWKSQAVYQFAELGNPELLLAL